MNDSSSSRVFVAVRGAVYASVFLSLWAWLALSLRRYDQRLPLTIPDWLRPVGWLLGTTGAILVVACVAAFIVRGRGTPAPFDPPREFVAVGPYRYVRNPMYLGAFAMLLGFGLVLRSPAMIGLALLFLLLVHLFVVLYEETSLSRRFGERYDEYKVSVRRWLPRGRPLTR